MESYETMEPEGKPAHEIFRDLSDTLFSKISGAINNIEGDTQYNKKVIEKRDDVIVKPSNTSVQHLIFSILSICI